MEQKIRKKEKLPIIRQMNVINFPLALYLYGPDHSKIGRDGWYFKVTIVKRKELTPSNLTKPLYLRIKERNSQDPIVAAPIKVIYRFGKVLNLLIEVVENEPSEKSKKKEVIKERCIFCLSKLMVEPRKELVFYDIDTQKVVYIIRAAIVPELKSRYISEMILHSFALGLLDCKRRFFLYKTAYSLSIYFSNQPGIQTIESSLLLEERDSWIFALETEPVICQQEISFRHFIVNKENIEPQLLGKKIEQVICKVEVNAYKVKKNFITNSFVVSRGYFRTIDLINTEDLTHTLRLFNNQNRVDKMCLQLYFIKAIPKMSFVEILESGVRLKMSISIDFSKESLPIHAKQTPQGLMLFEFFLLRLVRNIEDLLVEKAGIDAFSFGWKVKRPGKHKKYYNHPMTGVRESTGLVSMDFIMILYKNIVSNLHTMKYLPCDTVRLAKELDELVNREYLPSKEYLLKIIFISRFPNDKDQVSKRIRALQGLPISIIFVCLNQGLEWSLRELLNKSKHPKGRSYLTVLNIGRSLKEWKDTIEKMVLALQEEIIEYYANKSSIMG